MSRKAPRPEMQHQLALLAELSDERIDTNDIPDAPPEAWQHARRPGLYRSRCASMPISSPGSRSTPMSAGYQTEINRVLRRYVAAADAR